MQPKRRGAPSYPRYEDRTMAIRKLMATYRISAPMVHRLGNFGITVGAFQKKIAGETGWFSEEEISQTEKIVASLIPK
jgi:hypothetical protein